MLNDSDSQINNEFTFHTDASSENFNTHIICIVHALDEYTDPWLTHIVVQEDNASYDTD